MAKIRLDILVAERGLAESRAKAQALVMAGQVRVDGELFFKPAQMVAANCALTVDSGPRYVSRGGEKLEGALSSFPIVVDGRVCADVGSSTGGFTDCLLQNGAQKVYAIDVGKGILHWKLRTHPRVVVMEETNARYVTSLPEAVQLVVCDASFISLKVLLPVMFSWLAASAGAKVGEALVLIKPQFEAGRKDAAKHKGVIRDAEIHRRILLDVLNFAQGLGFGIRGLARSPILGPKGNVEFLAWLAVGEATGDVSALVETVFLELPETDNPA